MIATVGRMDQLHSKCRIETLIRSLSKFSEQALLIISGQSKITADAQKIGPPLIFEQLWKETGIKDAIKHAIFLTVLHRLMVSGSDRFCSRWCRDYLIDGIGGLVLHHLYRAMGFLGEEVSDQIGATPFSPPCNKNLIEELVFAHRRDLFSNMDLVFFDATSIYFEGHGGESSCKRGGAGPNP